VECAGCGFGLRRELAEETGTVVAVGDFVGVFVDRYGGGDDAVSVLNLVWEARVAAGEPEPADDVAELRWFERDRLPDEDEFAFTWLGGALRRWAQAG
jgi:ADP-ribose pyrophosphatase YjhB (NUDIX family)